MHPSKSIIGEKSSELSGKTVLFCISSSVAIYYAPHIARELMRQGANVIFIASAEAQKLIGSTLLEWATGNPAIIEMTGATEHIALAGLPHLKERTIILVYPATANTICKIAAGIADTPPTLFASTALGNAIPIILVPAMHLALYKNPATQKAISTIIEMKGTIVQPIIKGDKAHIASPEETVATVLRKSRSATLEGKKILVTAGATREFLDPIRFMSNPASGKMGLAIAKEIWTRGGEVTFVIGHVDVSCPPWIRTEKFLSTKEMFNFCLDELKVEQYDAAILTAAMADFTPVSVSETKIKSVSDYNIKLKPTEKLSDSIKQISPSTKLILFKAEHNVSREELIKVSTEKLLKTKADFIIANDVSAGDAGFQVDTNRILIITNEGTTPEELYDKKDNLAKIILDRLFG